MTIVPLNGYILCEKVVQEQNSSVFIYDSNPLPVYKIFQIYIDDICEKFSVGDITYKKITNFDEVMNNLFTEQGRDKYLDDFSNYFAYLIS